jgi:hypothetical protein
MTDDVGRMIRLLDHRVTLERAYVEINSYRSRAAATTIEALTLSLRERGTADLEESAVQRRLAELDDEQLLEVARRLKRLNPEIAKLWGDDEIAVLFGTRARLLR